jgi:hypothetical protein
MRRQQSKASKSLVGTEVTGDSQRIINPLSMDRPKDMPGMLLHGKKRLGNNPLNWVG